MAEAMLVGGGYGGDRIFDLSDPGNRDDCFKPFHLLAEELRRRGVELHTPDRIRSAPVFELHLDVHKRISSAPCYLLQMETDVYWSRNRVIPEYYSRILTWNDDLVDGARIGKYCLPYEIRPSPMDGMASRPGFCCMIAGNKAMPGSDPRELYSERVSTIRWFEKNAPQDFDLYGSGWHLPVPTASIAGKLKHRLLDAASALFPRRPFPSYKGRVVRKHDALRRYRYSVCYENVRGIQGYITEKIFDCLVAGCVPIYWGAPNVANFIPQECFIDRRRFLDVGGMYSYLKSIGDDEYLGYQREIAAFLDSDAANRFGLSTFVSTLVATVVPNH